AHIVSEGTAYGQQNTTPVRAILQLSARDGSEVALTEEDRPVAHEVEIEQVVRRQPDLVAEPASRFDEDVELGAVAVNVELIDQEARAVCPPAHGDPPGDARVGKILAERHAVGIAVLVAERDRLFGTALARQHAVAAGHRVPDGGVL